MALSQETIEKPGDGVLVNAVSPISAYVAKLSDRAIQRMVGGNAFLRGRLYARRGGVYEIQANGTYASARIHGRTNNGGDPLAAPQIEVGSDGQLTSRCTCLAWRGPNGHCKHVAALVIALRDTVRPSYPKPIPPQEQSTNTSGNASEEDASSGSKRRRNRRRRRNAASNAPAPINVVSAARNKKQANARTGLDIWLAEGETPQTYSFEYRMVVQSTSIAITPVLEGTRSAIPLVDALDEFNRVSAQDRPILRALARHVSKAKSATGELRAEDAAEVIGMMRHCKVLLEPASMELRFLDEPLKPKMELEKSGANNLRLRVVFQNQSGVRRFSLASGAWFEGTPGWFIDTTEGTARPISDSVTPGWLQRLYRSPALVQPVDDLPYMLSDFVPRVAASIGAELPDLSGVAQVIDAKPSFQLRVDGDLVEARARIIATYAGHECFVPPHALPSPLAFLPPDNDLASARVVRREVGTELACIQAMFDLGFEVSPDDQESEPLMVVRGEQAIHFWTQGIQSLPEEWERFIPHDLSQVQIRKQNVKPQVRVSSGVDWLNLDMRFDVDGVAVDERELRACLEKGRRLVRLEDGSYAPVNHEEVGEILTRMAELVAYDRSQLPLSQAGRVQHLLTLVEKGEVARDTQALFKKLNQPDAVDILPKPRDLKATFRPYQKLGFSWLGFIHTMRSGGILADDMGLGKTLQTIALLARVRQQQEGCLSALVIAPTSVVPNWQSEIGKFAPSFTSLVWQGPDRHEHKDDFADADVVITNYALLRRDEEFLRTHQFDYVILDEAQHIKNPLSATARAAKRLPSERRLALTGTPIENRLSEIWSIFDFVSPGLLGDLKNFEENYAKPIDRGDEESAKQLRETIMPFILRRTKGDVAKDLPDKIEQQIIVPMTDEQSTLYKQILGQVRDSVLSEVKKQGVAKSQIQILAALTRLRQVACDPRLTKLSGDWGDEESGKLNALREIIQEATSGQHRVLIFSQFVEMLKLMATVLDKDGVSYEYLDGSTKDRMERVDRFNADESISVFLISLKAGGTGLNLTGADTVIHFDPWWNPAVEDQATDRAHRIGQTRQVHVYRLIARHSVEQKILKLSAKKRGLIANVLSTEGSPLKGLTQADVDTLFSE